MSSAEEAARQIKSLEPEDWDVLRVLEKFMRQFESIPKDLVVKQSMLHSDQVEFRLGRLNYFGFIIRGRHGYIINTAGLDALALNSFVKKELVYGMGKSIGMGKESDVFEVINDIGTKAVIKFYRIGRISFRSTRKTRTYVSPENQHQWLEINIGAAQKEAEGLTRAGRAGVSVPTFIARDRHAVLMSEIDGAMLFNVAKEDIGNPKKLLRSILENLRITYLGANIINGDISEYNILFDGDKPWIIDWPQFVSTNHANAAELLKRDVANCVTFFKRRFGIFIDLEDSVSYITGRKSSIKIGDG